MTCLTSSTNWPFVDEDHSPDTVLSFAAKTMSLIFPGIPCPPPPEIPNGRHDDTDNYVYGTAVTYRCNAGFSLIGNKTIVCTYDQRENGMWSGSAPECKGDSIEHIKMNFHVLICFSCK